MEWREAEAEYTDETITEFRLVPEEWTAENDLLTPSMKKKRRTIRDRYATELADMYEGTSGPESVVHSQG